MMSQHSQHSQTNGASLEDCHTNFFALTDLCGIKWRVYTWESTGVGDPLEDPVLLSYSRCLAADVLCVWRRTWQPSPSGSLGGFDHCLGLGGGADPRHHLHPPASQYRHSLRHSPKELWVFWYGDEPDLSSLVSRELTKNEGNQQGSWDWETGLSYECRTILFKALHNLIERCLLTRGFIRLGKWFVQPFEGPEAVPSSKDTHLSFSLSFFVHGESTVCTSVDIRKHPPVRTLAKKHILTAQQISNGIPVILAPYGLKGTLTGATHRLSESATQKLLDDWKRFFPIDSPRNPPSGRGDGPNLPNFVEVIVGGFRLRYPTCFVLVTDMDREFFPPQAPLHSSLGKGGNENAMPVVEDTCTMSGKSYSSVSSPFTASTHTLLMSGCLNKTGTGLGWTRGRSETVWQDIIKCPLGNQSSNDGLIPDVALTATELAGQWEFADPATKIACSCLKCRIGRDPKANMRIGYSGVEKGWAGTATCGVGNRSGCGDAGLPPFHWRVIPTPPVPSLLTCGLEDFDLFPITARITGSGSTHIGNSFGGYKGNSIATPGSVPSLRTTGVADGPPPSEESPPVSVTPSPLPTPRTPHSQPTSVTPHHDSTMPLLSPHQPPSNTSIGDPTTPAAVDSVDAKNNLSDILGPKSVSSLNHSMSPYPGSIEGAKLPGFGDNVSADTPGSTSRPNVHSSNANPYEFFGLRKPCLPTSEYNNLSDDGSLMNIFDASKLTAWLHHPVKKFRPSEPRVEHPLWPPYRPSHIAPKFEATVKKEGLLKSEVKVELEMNGVGGRSMLKRGCGGVKRIADPYDFEEDAGGVTPLDGFKIKEEKDDSKGVTDPLSPSKKLSNLYTLEGLVPKVSDLDDIFDSPMDDYAQTPPGSNKPINGLDDGTSLISSSKSNCTGAMTSKNGPNNITELTQLAKMYPTPPSLEPNPDHDTVLEDIPIEEHHHPTYQDVGYMDLPLVYRPMAVSPFIGPDKYKPLVDLPSKQDRELANLSSDFVYNPSWQVEKVSHPPHPHVSQQLPTSSHLVSNLGPSIPHMVAHHQAHLGLPVKLGMCPISPATSTLSEVGPLSQRGPGSAGGPMSAGAPMSYELPSPASNQSAYLNKTLPSIEPAPPLPSMQVPEANSLMTNIVLQDSSINLFRDHNFDSCTMCVCNNSQKVLGNIKGSDGTIYLPPSHLSSEEEYIGCSCGFSAVVNRRLAFQSGLFYEDEVDLTGLHEDLLSEKRRHSFQTLLDIKNSEDRLLNNLDMIPAFVNELVKSQSIVTLCTPSSVLYRAVAINDNARRNLINLVDYKDGNETAYLALEQSRTAHHHHEWESRNLAAQGRQCVMHKWCYLQFDGPSCSQDMIRCMKALQPYLQDAIQKKRSTRLWEPVYNVSGPLTWRQFHRMAVRGTEDMAEPLPIPLLLAGHDKDWLSIAPQSIQQWEKLLLEPYTQPRNVAYVIVSPDNEFVLKHVRSFFKDLSSIYELCRLGRHAPIRRVLRDGIMRVSKRAAGKVANETLDDWFSLLGDSQIFTKLRMYSQICSHTLAPHLTTLNLDKSLFDIGHIRTNDRSSDQKHQQAPSPMPPPSNTSGDSVTSGSLSSCVSQQSGEGTDNAQGSSASGSTPFGFGPGSSLVEVDEDESPPPAIMVYLVDPFTVGQDQPDLHRLITIGLLRCYKAMLDRLPESMQNHIYVQIISLESILELARESHDKAKKIDLQKSLAFSVFMQCRRVLAHSSIAKSLTGFGPAAVFDTFLRPSKDVDADEKSLSQYPVFSPAYILAPVKESRGRHKEAEEALGDPREKSTVLYCTYCLTEDQKWLIASATDELGELLETVTINIEIPNRTRRKKASSRRHGLKKLMDWILGVMSIGVHPWRLVVGRLGRIGHGELKGWLSLLSRKSLAKASKNLKEMCKQCSYLFPGMAPCILSACLVSMEPDSTFRMMPDMFTPDERFGQNSQNCTLSTPQDATCTHILVFPTSATAQSAQQRFQDEPAFNFVDGENDLFPVDEVEDMGGGIGMGGMGINFSDILSMETAPTQELDTLEDGSGAAESMSQPGSPTSLGLTGRSSPSQFSGQARSNGVVMVDPHEDMGGSALQQQPLALGYYVSTASTGKLPRWFWSSCPHLEHTSPTFLKSALHLNQPAVTQAEDYMHNATTKVHPLDSTCTADVLRFVLEGYNGLSWLVLDPSMQDRRSCLPLHMQVLSHLYNIMAAII